ncbi:IS3 family transposase [Mesorhizobium sp. M0923]
MKLAAVQRMAMGANVSKLSRELGVSRKGLYQWQKQFRVGGSSALRGAGRPQRVEAVRRQAIDPAVPAPSDTSDERRRHWLASPIWNDWSDRRPSISIFFSKPCSTSGKNASRAARLAGTVIQAMMASGLQGVIGIERMCRLAGVSGTGYYLHWQVSSPRREEAGLRDVIQRLALSNPHYGYRRIAVLLGRESWRANHKRVLRLMREDNLLCLRRQVSCR